MHREDKKAQVIGTIRVSDDGFVTCWPLFKKGDRCYSSRCENGIWQPGNVLSDTEVLNGEEFDLLEEGESITLEENDLICILSPSFLDQLARVNVLPPDGRMATIASGDLVITLQKVDLAHWRHYYIKRLQAYHELTMSKIAKRVAISPLDRTHLYYDLDLMKKTIQTHDTELSSLYIWDVLAYDLFPAKFRAEAMRDGSQDTDIPLKRFKTLVKQERARLIALTP